MTVSIDIDVENYIDDISDELIASEFERRFLAVDNLLYRAMEDAREELLRGRYDNARAIIDSVLFPKWSTRSECEQAYRKR